MTRLVRAAALLAAAPAAVRRGRSFRPSRATVPPAAQALPPAPPPGRGLQAARGVLIGVGVVLLLTGAVFEVTVSKPAQVPGVLLWLAAAVVLHDAVLSPLAFAANLVLKRVGRRLPPAVIAVVQVAVVVGVVLAFVGVPTITAKSLGPRNPSVLVGDYRLALPLLLVGLAVVTAAVCAVLLARARRTPARDGGA